MGRLHLFELEDQRWLPASLRDVATDWLTFAVTQLDTYRPVVPLIRQALEATWQKRIIDLCSGSAGPALCIQRHLAAANVKVEITLTDLFPNMPAFRHAAAKSQGAIFAIPDPVDASAVPPALEGLRTMFTAFHHFRPAVAREILADAVRQRQGIAIFEFTERRVGPIIGSMIMPIIALLLLIPFVRPLRWTRLFWTYVVPVAPLFVAWDATVSCLRTYTPDELRELVLGLPANDYVWQVGELPSRPGSVSYLVGYPKA
jgi:hypothetical protein